MPCDAHRGLVFYGTESGEARTCSVGESHEGGARYDGDRRRRRVVEAAEAVPGPTTPRRRLVEFCGCCCWSADLAGAAGASGRAARQPVVTLDGCQRGANTRHSRRVLDVRYYRLHRNNDANNHSDDNNDNCGSSFTHHSYEFFVLISKFHHYLIAEIN